MCGTRSPQDHTEEMLHRARLRMIFCSRRFWISQCLSSSVLLCLSLCRSGCVVGQRFVQCGLLGGCQWTCYFNYYYFLLLVLTLNVFVASLPGCGRGVRSDSVYFLHSSVKISQTAFTNTHHRKYCNNQVLLDERMDSSRERGRWSPPTVHSSRTAFGLQNKRALFLLLLDFFSVIS